VASNPPRLAWPGHEQEEVTKEPRSASAFRQGTKHLAEHLVRFVGERVDPDSGEPEGLFQLAFRVRREGRLEGVLRTRLEELLEWLTANLASPRRLSPFRNALGRGRRRTSRRRALAISWFKAEATEHLERARALAQILNHSGHSVREIRTSRPGYVTNEDARQVQAVPFRGEPSDG